MSEITFIFRRGVSFFRKLRTSMWAYIPLKDILFFCWKKEISSVDVFDRLDEMLGEFNKDIVELANVGHRNNVVSLANKALSHEYKHLGSGWIKKDPMIWNSDLKTGFCWPNGVFYKKQTSYTPKGADIKMPWDLSRCHHVLWLSEAYVLTGDEKYAEEAVIQIASWIDSNKFLYSVNWVCPMDVAIRASNWIYALHFLKGSMALNDRFCEKAKRSLFEHGYFIRHNLEKGAGRNFNHYTADLAGLLLVGMLFDRLSIGRRWWKYAEKELYNDILVQVLPSGIHYEKSISYHRLMVEFYSYSFYVLRRLKRTIPKEAEERVQLMYNFVSVYTKPNMKAPLISDNDNGRFLPFSYGDFCDHTYLIDSQSLDVMMVGNLEDLMYKSVVAYDGIKLYEDAGFAIVRQDNNYLFVVNSGYSRYPNPYNTVFKSYSGMHNHNDLLSFELSVENEDVFVDSGSFIYTADIAERNRFRMTSKHNTIVVDGEEQNQLGNNAFSFIANSHVNLLEEKEHIIKGSYYTKQGGLFHERTFEMQKCGLCITDYVKKEGKSHHVDFYLHLAPGFYVEKQGNDITAKNNNIEVRIISDFGGCEQFNDVSPSYGIKEPMLALKYSSQFEDKHIYKTKITWTKLNSK